LKMTIRNIKGLDGTNLHVEDQNPKTGSTGGSVPFVLLDGIGCDGYVWKYINDKFQDTRRIIHPHYRGHGLSAPPEDMERLTIQDLCDDLDCVLKACKVRKAILFGHSMGVQVALDYTGRHPGKVAGLVLLTGAPGRPLDTFHDTGLLKAFFPQILNAISSAPGLAQLLWSAVLPTKLSWEVARRTEINGQLVKYEDFMPYLEHLSHMDIEIFTKMLYHASNHSAEEYLATIKAPTLIIAGERDTFTPLWLSHKMHRLIPGSELLVLPGGSHTGPIEHPELINLRLEKWLLKNFDKKKKKQGSPKTRRREKAGHASSRNSR